MKLKREKVDFYYQCLEIDKNNFEIEADVRLYVENITEDIKIAAILESFSVLSHPELKRIYDSFIEKDLEDDFLTLIGSQFYCYYKHPKKNKCSEKEYIVEKLLLERVLKIAQKLEESGKSSFEIVDGKKVLTRETINIFSFIYTQEFSSNIASLEKKWKEESGLKYDELFFNLFCLVFLRSDIFFSKSIASSNLDCMINEYTEARVFFIRQFCFSFKCRVFFYNGLLQIADRKTQKKMSFSDELVFFSLTLKKFLAESSPMKSDAENIKLMRLFCNKEYDVLSYLNLNQNNYEKVWEKGYDFLENWKSSFLEEPSEVDNVSKIVAEPSEVDNVSKIVAVNKETTFKKKGIVPPLILLIFVITLFLGFLKWLVFGNREKRIIKKVSNFWQVSN